MPDYIYGNVTITSAYYLTHEERSLIVKKWRDFIGTKDDVFFNVFSGAQLPYTVTVRPVSKTDPEMVASAACDHCGRLYGDEHGFPDLVVEDDIWELLMPGSEGGGLLCPSCMCQRAHELNLHVKAKFTSGPFREVTVNEVITQIFDNLRERMTEAVKVSVDESLTPQWELTPLSEEDQVAYDDIGFDLTDLVKLSVAETVISDERKPECVKRWPNCCPGEIHPDCCRFPKSCSCLRFTGIVSREGLVTGDQRDLVNNESMIEDSLTQAQKFNMPQAEAALEQKLAESFELPIELVSEPKITGYITETDIPNGDWRIALSPDLDFVSHDNVNNIYTYLDGETNRFVVVIDNLYVIESDTILDLSDIWDLCRAYERKDTRKRSGRYKARIRKTNSPWRFGWDDN